MLDRLPVRWTSRADACEALARLVLFDLSDPKHADLRRRAGLLLCALARDEEVPGLVALARDDPDPRVRQGAFAALARIGPVLPPVVVVSLLERAGTEERHAATCLAQACELSDAEEVLATATRIAEDLDPDTRATLLRRLAHRDRRGAAEPLLAWLRARWARDGCPGATGVLYMLVRARLALTRPEVDAWLEALGTTSSRSSLRLLFSLARRSPELLEGLLASPDLLASARADDALPLPVLVDLLGEERLWASFVAGADAIDQASRSGDELAAISAIERVERLIRRWPAAASRMLAVAVAPERAPRTAAALARALLVTCRTEAVAAALRARAAEERPLLFGSVLERCARDPVEGDRELFEVALAGPRAGWRALALRGLLALPGGQVAYAERCRALEREDTELSVSIDLVLSAAGDTPARERLLAHLRSGAARPRTIRSIGRYVPPSPARRAALEAALRDREPLPARWDNCDEVVRAIADVLADEGSPEAITVLLASSWRAAADPNARYLRGAIARAAGVVATRAPAAGPGSPAAR